MRSSMATRPSQHCSWSIVNAPGLTCKREPKFTHTYVFSHPESRVFKGSKSAPTACWEESDWGSNSPSTVVEARLQIAANCLGVRLVRIRQLLGLPTGSVRRADPAPPGDRFHAGRHGRRNHGRKKHDLPRRMEIDQQIDRKVAHARASVTARVRYGRTRARQRGTESRARLHAREPGRAARDAPRLSHLGGDFGDPVFDHRPPTCADPICSPNGTPMLPEADHPSSGQPDSAALAHILPEEGICHDMIKRSPVPPQVRLELGATFVDRLGFAAPLVFTSTEQEHRATREAVGVFDVYYQIAIGSFAAGRRAISSRRGRGRCGDFRFDVRSTPRFATKRAA